MKFKRVFLIVLDSFGVGALPDAEVFGDEGSHTLRSVASSPSFSAPHLTKLGLFSIPGAEGGVFNGCPLAAYGKAAELSAGKDTVTGHWEIAGLISKQPMPTYPEGFPADLLKRIEAETGIGTLCNRPYSGTEVIRDYGREQAESGKMIVYTSADSVYQAAAHNDVIPLDRLYAYCEKAREILRDEHAVGRVIARPFVGQYPDYRRTSDRHDYALPPTGSTMLDLLSERGYDTITVGKISDIFAGCGVTRRIPTTSNADGMAKTSLVAAEDFTGLCFVNLVDFDSRYGHRNDVDGYAAAISEFDSWLGGFLKGLKKDDLLILTADHGCDPKTESTDHSREYIPILAYARGILPLPLGVRQSFADIGKTVCNNFGIESALAGESFLPKLGFDGWELLQTAGRARENAYAPYSHFCVGAALLCRDGSVISGCNVESAAYSPTCCAERTALVKALSEGKRDFLAIAIVGGKKGTVQPDCTPCGVCRQMLYELGGKELLVITAGPDGAPIYRTMSELLPNGFDLKESEEISC